MTFVTVHICSFIEKRLRTNRTCSYAQLQDIARESLEKIKRGIQHATGTQLRGIQDCLDTTYDEFLC